MYYATGKITYSTTANKTTAMTAMQNALNAFPNVTGFTSAYPAGLVTLSTTAITFSLAIPDSDFVAFRSQFVAAWSGSTRTSSQTGSVWVAD